MKTIEIATELFSELNEDSLISPALISLWLTENIGRLNVLLSVEYTINPANSEFSPELGENEKSIFKQMFLVYFYDRKLRSILGGADSNSVVEVSEGGSTIRMLNKNEVAKTYKSIKTEEQNNLKMMIYAYKINNSAPIQIAGSDTIEQEFNSNQTNNRLI
jgi:hypothetical protein